MGEVAILNCIGNPIEWQQRIHWTFPVPRGQKGRGKNRRLNHYHRRREKRPKVEGLKLRSPPWLDFPIEHIDTDFYRPSLAAWKFHTSASRFRALVAGVKSGKCLTADQGVMLPDGTTKLARDLRPGDEILGLENGVSRPILVTAVESARKDCVEMVYPDGSVVRCSKDHRFPFWYYRGNCVVVRRVGEVLSPSKGLDNKYKFITPRLIHFQQPKPLATIKRDKTRIGLSSWRDIGQQDCVHISVDAANELFLLDNAVATHNSTAGAAETVRAALGLAGELHWVVAPVNRNLREPETEILRILNDLQPYGIRFERKLAKKQIRLNNGSVIEFVAGDITDNLRGPTINGSMWIDEVAFLREESFYVLRTRIITGQAEMWFTTSPNWRNWFWTLCRQMGLPATQPYGEFETKYSFIAHHPTWNFPWVPKSEIEGMRKTWPRKKFDAEIGGLFGSPDSQVFPGVRECLNLEPPPKELVGVNVLGLDLAQAQDFTAVIVMDPMGRVHHIDRWTGRPWKETVSKALKLAEQWGCIIAYDKSNVGSVIGELLDDSGIKTMPLDCHNAQLRNSMIQGLAVAFEQQQISLPCPTTKWAPDEAQTLLDELEQYEQGLTRGGSLTYSAPKGLHDDLVISLCMANWCRVRGGIGGAAAAIAIVPRKKWDKLANEKDIKRMVAEREAGKRVKIRQSRAGNPLARHYKGKMGWGDNNSGLWR